MKCPLCQQEMAIHRNDTTHSKQQKQFDRTIYTCGDDDVWVSVEIPQRNLPTQARTTEVVSV